MVADSINASGKGTTQQRLNAIKGGRQDDIPNNCLVRHSSMVPFLQPKITPPKSDFCKLRNPGNIELLPGAPRATLFGLADA